MDLFAGCGGFAEGFRSCVSGTTDGEPLFRTVAAVDIDAAALATFTANHRAAAAECCDIERFDASPYVDKIDVITGGPALPGLLKPRQPAPRRSAQGTMGGVRARRGHGPTKGLRHGER
ncbi:DNA cytosine methyltransferase [Streptomyces niveus]